MPEREQEHFIGVRVDLEHKKLIVAMAKKKGLNLSAFIRSLLYEKLEEEAARAAA